MKASDYIAKFLEKNGITSAFGMSGGAIIHLVDSLYNNTDISVVSGSHEQYSAFEADGWCRAKDMRIPGICFATSGPGATNLITGIATAYYDSIPLIVFTGQVARHRQKGELEVRQFGFQELPSIDVISPIVKNSYQPKNGKELVHALREGWELSISGRPGPVHIELADDLQRDNVDIDNHMFAPYTQENKLNANEYEEARKLLSGSSSTLVLVGNGARSSKDLLRRFLSKTQLPCVSTWAGIDLVSGLDNYIGVIGTYSPRYNYILEKCDLLVSLGCRLSNNIIGSRPSDFATMAKKIIVDIDAAELEKLDRLKIPGCIAVNTTCTSFLESLINLGNNSDNLPKSEITVLMDSISREKTGIVSQEISCLHYIMSDIIRRFNIRGIFLDTGNNLSWSCNILASLNYRLPGIYSSWNNTPMGYSVPAAIGFCLGKNREPTMAVIGDGGLGICLSELFLIAKMKLPIMILLIENGGHNIQKQTIETWLNGAYALVDEESNLYIPNYEGLSEYVGIQSIMIENSADVENFKNLEWDHKTPILVRVKVSVDARSFPIVPFGKKLTDPLSL